MMFILAGIPIAWSSGESPRVSTSRYAGEIKAAAYGYHTALVTNILRSELLCGNEGSVVETCVRNDSSNVVEHVRSVNSITNGRRLSGFPESNRGRSKRMVISSSFFLEGSVLRMG